MLPFDGKSSDIIGKGWSNPPFSCIDHDIMLVLHVHGFGFVAKVLLSI